MTRFRYWFALFGSLLAFGSQSAIALPIADGTLNTQTTLFEDSLMIIDGGTSEGNNLFHSFGSFNIDAGEEVYFFSPAEIDNIFGRVTGESRSEINGVLGTFGSNADLFLMNPYGVIFGADASLDVQGSFAVTTASSIRSDSGGLFSAINPNSSQLFSIDPSAFFFTRLENPGAITSQAQAVRNSRVNPEITLQGLEVSSNETLLLLGGNINIDGGRLVAEGVQLEIGSVVGDVAVGLSPDRNLEISDQLQRGDVRLSNAAAVFAASDTGSGIRIFANNINASGGSSVGASNNFILEDTSSQIGSILLDATNNIIFTDGARITNILDSSSGSAGDVAIQAGSSVVFSGTSEQDNPSGVFLGADFSTESGTGNINILAGELRVEDGASLSIRTSGVGNAGDIIIKALERVVFAGENERTGNPSSVTVETGSGELGDGGNLEISTGEFRVIDGAQLSVSTSGTGNTGDIRIDATGNVDLVGTTNTGRPSAIFTTVDPGAQGQGGNIAINAGQDLRVANGAQLSVSTFGDGNLGNIVLQAANNSIFETSSSVAVLVGSGSRGEGGNLNIVADNLFVSDGAQLNIAVFGDGEAGDIKIDVANDATFDGVDPIGGGSSSATINIGSGSEGRGGNLEITANNLFVTNGAQLGIFSSEFGDAGDVVITISEDIVVSNPNSSVTLSSASSGGTILVEAQKLQVRNGAAFRVSTAGLLSINAVDRVIITGADSGLFVTFPPFGSIGEVEVNTGRLELDFEGAIVSSAPGGNGGDLRLGADRILVLRNGSQISATAGDNSSNGPRGGGGNIFIDAPFIVAIPEENSDITANGGTSGGRISIRGQRFGIEPRDQLTPLSDITAFSDAGSGGEINLGSASLSESVTSDELPDALIDPDLLIASSCVVRRQESEGTFSTTGNNPAPGPSSALSTIYSVGNVRPVDGTVSFNEPGRQVDTLLEPKGIYQLADGRLVMGRTCASRHS